MQNNKVTLIGYVGNNLTSSKLKNGSKRVAIRMATHQSTKNSSGKKVYYSVWHDVIAWDRTAEFAEKNFVKGSRIMVDGSISYKTYPDPKGHIRYVTQIRAHSLVNLDR